MCVKILRGFKLPIYESIQIKLGTTEQVFIASEYTRHRHFIMKFLPPDWYKKKIHEFNIEKLCGQPCIKLIAESWDNPLLSPESPNLALVRRRIGKRFVGHGKVLKRHWINEREIQRWKNTCDQNQGNNCRMRSAISSLPDGNPDWLIDTRRQCLIPAGPELSYSALNYVWGRIEFFKATRSNLQQLQCDSAFSDIGGSLKISQTIKDAIALVRILGERYLWIDSLCIVQDDDTASKEEQFNKMAAIFAKADVTIIAEEGPNSFYGLRGLHGVSRPSNLPQRVYELQKGLKIIESRRPKRVGQSIWNQRGWTFQEHLFSNRRIIFYEGTVRWECDCGVWYEGLDQPNIQNLPHPTIRSHQILFQLHYPDLQKYDELVTAFNVRHLTDSEDVLRAFAGITYSLSSKFDGGFLCGLPVMFFDTALLWRPSGPLERRISLNSAAKSCIPSWSWAGWRGEVDPKSWLTGCDYRSDCISDPGQNYQITPLVKWYSQEREKPARRRVESRVLKFREAFFGEDRQPPPNWIREKCYSHIPRDAGCRYSVNGYPSDGCVLPRYWYKHEFVPETAFWYPIPLCSEGQDPVPYPAATLLSCETKRAWFCLGEKISRRQMSFSLRHQDGSWAGVIHLHEDPPKRNLTSCDPKNVSQERRCKLVAISLGQAYNSIEDLDLAEWKMRERPKQTPMYEFYNVLWIEWKERIAYRKGIGRVMKDIWDRQALQCFHLILG